MSEELNTLIGQMLLVGFKGKELSSEMKGVIKRNKIGNVILFSENIENMEQLAKLTADIRATILEATGYPAFIGIDQEGGVVTRLSQDIPQIPGAMAMAAGDEPENAYKAGYLTGEQLRLMGINLDFAPVMDVNCNRKNPVIGVRSYGETAEQVMRFAMKASKGLEDAGVASCAKHFPGHGDTDVDSHLGLPVVDKTYEELCELELRPFAEAVKQGIASIMTTHIMFPKIDEKFPATMSKEILTGILRDKMGYEGVVCTDCLEMGAIKDHFGSANGSLNAAIAGADMLCFSHTYEYAEEAAALLKKAVEDGSLPVSRVEEAAGRILKLKKRFEGESPDVQALMEKVPEYKKTTTEFFEKSLTVVSNERKREFKLGADTLFLCCDAYRSTIVSSNPLAYNFASYAGDKLGCQYQVTPLRPDEGQIAEIVEKAKSFGTVVLGTYNAHILPEQMKLVRALEENIKDLVIVAFRNPYDLYEEGPALKIAAYEYSIPVFDALLNVFGGELVPTGKVPR